MDKSPVDYGLFYAAMPLVAKNGCYRIISQQNNGHFVVGTETPETPKQMVREFSFEPEQVENLAERVLAGDEGAMTYNNGLRVLAAYVLLKRIGHVTDDE